MILCYDVFFHIFVLVLWLFWLWSYFLLSFIHGECDRSSIYCILSVSDLLKFTLEIKLSRSFRSISVAQSFKELRTRPLPLPPSPPLFASHLLPSPLSSFFPLSPPLSFLLPSRLSSPFSLSSSPSFRRCLCQSAGPSGWLARWEARFC